MKRESIFLVIILLIMAGCSGNKQSTDAFITIDVTASYPKKELILQEFLDIEYISLETSDEFLTSANIQDIGKDIIILRNMGGDGDIFIFDRNGKGLRKINRLGQGGEEYTNILGVTLDEDNHEIYINNHFLSKELVYDLSGNFKRSFKQRDNFFYGQTGNFDHDNLICWDGLLEYYKPDVKRNFFMLVSKQDGSIKEVSIPYQEKKKTRVIAYGADGRIVNDMRMFNRELTRDRDSWILTESSADTIYRYSPDRTLTPIIARTPSIQAMDLEIFLFPGVFTDSYYFMQSVKKAYEHENGYPRTDLLYDRQEKAIFECVVYNNDFTSKKPMSLVWEYPMFIILNNEEIAFAKRLEAPDLVEAYNKGELKGKLKEIAATLDEEDNPVIMLAKYKK